jgi:hypothetical protein
MAMKKIDIWVEGIADQKFLADAMYSWFGLLFDKNFQSKSELFAVRIRSAKSVTSFVETSGWENIRPDFEENRDQAVKNLIIADADSDVENRRKEIANTVVNVAFNADVDLFLFPNQQESGDLETLLERIIQPQHQAIFDCWNTYENCLDKQNKSYTTPAKKTKIYAYLEALLGETKNEKEKIKERERDYTNSNHWNLSTESVPLKPLHDFLKKHLITTWERVNNNLLF